VGKQVLVKAVNDLRGVLLEMGMRFAQAPFIVRGDLEIGLAADDFLVRESEGDRGAHDFPYYAGAN
jgi:hypothetical protein